jgi:phage terminase small subunit
MELTPKQEKFAHLYVELGNASAAYRGAYDAERMKPETVTRRAFDMLENGKIKAIVTGLRKEHADRHAVTVDSLIAELEEARKIALADRSPAPAVSATMGKARITGLDKHVIDHKSSDGSMTPAIPLDAATIMSIARQLDDEC